MAVAIGMRLGPQRRVLALPVGVEPSRLKGKACRLGLEHQHQGPRAGLRSRGRPSRRGRGPDRGDSIAGFRQASAETVAMTMTMPVAVGELRRIAGQRRNLVRHEFFNLVETSDGQRVSQFPIGRGRADTQPLARPLDYGVFVLLLNSSVDN